MSEEEYLVIEAPWHRFTNHDWQSPSFPDSDRPHAPYHDVPIHRDIHGDPINLELWAWLLEDRAYVSIADHVHFDPGHDQPSGDITFDFYAFRVSTIWTGLWSWPPDCIFETMLFCDPRYDEELPAGEPFKSPTYLSAIQMHDQLVQLTLEVVGVPEIVDSEEVDPA